MLTPTTPVASGTTTPAPKGKKGLGAAIFITAIFLLVLKWIFFSNKENISENEKEIQKTNQIQNFKPAVSMVKEIVIDSAYGEPFYIADGFNFSFFDASEPWCVKNESQEEICGEKGQDLSQYLGEKNENNRTLWFRSKGKKGAVKILLVSRY